ncbi:MAG: FG-GAP repeat domain-containing protein [Nitrospirota bacterium]
MGISFQLLESKRARGTACALAAVAWLTGCGAEDFPGAPGLDGNLDVPYVTTYNFGLKVGFSPIFGDNGNLLIISSSDLLNLVSAANITRAPATGVLSGRVLNFTGGGSVANVQLLATDVDGRPVGDFFYNSLGGTPDFVQTRGTVSAGGFTAFNVPPGQVFMKAVGGARGGTRFAAFPEEVSLDVVWVNPVVVPFIGVLGEISDGTGAPITAAGDLGVEVVGQPLSEAVACAEEVPTQTRVEAVLREPASGNNTTAFRFCVASEGLYWARITGNASFVPTYQIFTADNATLTALQTTELTEFMTVYKQSDLERAASAAGTTWDRSKGVLAGRITVGGAPRSGVAVRITDEGGNDLAQPIGGGPDKGAIVYLDALGNPLRDQLTGGSGRFIALNLEIPDGRSSTTVYLTAIGQRFTQGVPERFTAVGHAPIFAGAVTHANAALTSHVTPIQGEDNNPPYFTGPVSGRVMREDGLAVVPNATITPLGIPLGELPNRVPEVFEANADGQYDVPFNSDPAAVTPLLQDRTYLVRVEGASGTSEYLPTYQSLRTGTTEVDSTTGLWKTKIQDVSLVARSAIDGYLSAVGLAPLNPGKGVILGTAVDVRTNRPAPGISVRVTAVDGTDGSVTPSAQSASVYYFDFGGVPRPNLTSTTPDGRFVVFNAPPGSLSIDVTSPDDTGNIVADSRADGVTVVRLNVNNASSATVDVAGRFEPLVSGESPSGAVTLTVAGGDPMPLRRLCPTDAFERGGVCYLTDAPTEIVPKTAVPCSRSETYGPYRVLKKFENDDEGYCGLEYTADYASTGGAFRVPIGSSREVVLKTSGGDLVDTYTYGVTTGDRPMADVQVGVVTHNALSELARNAGRTQSDDLGVVLGQATTASLGEVDSAGNLVPRTCQSWTILPDQPGGCAALGAPGAVAAGNFNDDTYRDLAVIDETSSDPAVTVWLNTGDGAFARSQRIVRDPGCTMVPTPSAGCGVEDGPVALLVIDYNVDGLSDLIVLNQVSRSISLLQGRGRGKFVFGGSMVIGDSATVPNTLVSADFNRDGIPDLVITDRITGEIILLLGNTAGFVRPPTSISAPVVGSDPRAVVSAQLDFDTIPDLVFVTPNKISVMWLIGVANELVHYSVPAGQGADLSAVGIGDIDNDGFNDVVVADRAPGHLGAWVFHNRPFLNTALRLSSPTFIPAGPGLPIAVAVRDLNGDLSTDLIVMQNDGTLIYREGDGVGGFGPERVYTVGGGPNQLIMDDVTGDGNEDAVIADPGSDRIVVLPQTRQPVDGVAVAAVRADGRAVGDVVYLDAQGRPLLGAALTGASGRFAVLNVPPDPVWLRLLTGGLGSRFLHAYAGAVTNTTFPIIKGLNATTTVSGVTADAVVRPVGEVQLHFLGTQRVTSSNPLQFDADGNSIGGANYSAVVDANSDYVVKLSK